MELSKNYQPKAIERKTYQFWEKTGFFNPDKLPGKRDVSFTLLLPPPNVTGELHMGHALNIVLQDALLRQKRMAGFRTLWVPGTDHAGIATQNAVEKKLKKEGKTRFDLGKERFRKEVWKWKDKFGHLILEQLKKMGASCDWSRTAFTMSEDYSLAVKKAFKYYLEKGWIYQGKRPVNWCGRCQTSLSDLELEYKEEKGKLWYIKYPLKSEIRNTKYEINSKSQISNSKFITVATTRPETMFGDTAVAVNPKDKRYKKLVGKKVILPLTNREIPIVSDNLVNPSFGTGAVKVTPAHDLKDYQISLKQKLDMISVIDREGKMTGEIPQRYKGKKVLEARKLVLENLRGAKLLEREEDYVHTVPKCYRCSSTVEIIPSNQWFLKMEKLAKKAKAAVREGKIKIEPKNFEKIYFDWLDNIKDWCISRQIWWGHKIPFEGEEDVLDTWFSSALWPFATLGWPQKTEDLKTFYPTQALVTARDIINLWVSRMIFSGLEFMEEIPFPRVFIHPTILNKKGQRMSKSLGTGINPLDLIEKYGTDAVRFGLAWQVTGLQDIKFAEEDIVMGKKFCNKIWNASRFVLGQLKNSKSKALNSKQIQNPKFKNLTGADKKILKGLGRVTESVTKDIDRFQFHEATETLYHFFWHQFCDEYIEESKKQIVNSKLSENTGKILIYVLLNSLKLLHPFMPFLTEEVYQNLPLKEKKKSIMIEFWPNWGIIRKLK